MLAANYVPNKHIWNREAQSIYFTIKNGWKLASPRKTAPRLGAKFFTYWPLVVKKFENSLSQLWSAILHSSLLNQFILASVCWLQWQCPCQNTANEITYWFNGDFTTKRLHSLLLSFVWAQQSGYFLSIFKVNRWLRSIHQEKKNGITLLLMLFQHHENME